MKHIFMLIKLCFSFNILNIALSVYRQETYKFFDKFYLIDILQNFKSQLSKNYCSMGDGPYCYQIANIKQLKENDLLLDTIKNLTLNNTLTPKLENVLTILKKNLENFKKRTKAAKTQQFKLAPRVMMNLLLNFESYDPQTMIKDIYMPEEKIVNFNVGYLKFNFKGKLRLSHDKSSSYDNPPAKTYGIIEERDLYIKFDKPVLIKYLYIRPHLPIDSLSNYIIEIAGYKNEQAIYSIKESPILAPKQWHKIVPPEKIIDALKLPKDFEIDDVNISYDSELNQEKDKNEDLSNMIQTIIDEIMNKNKKLNKDDF